MTPSNWSLTEDPENFPKDTFAVFQLFPTAPFFSHAVLPSTFTFNVPMPPPFMWYPNSKYASEANVPVVVSRMALSFWRRGEDASVYT